MSHDAVFSRKSYWIGAPDACLAGWRRKVLPAPFFRNSFECGESISKAEVRICGLGYYELFINGRKVGDHVLDPVATHYDRRAGYVVYDVAQYLRPGVNVVGVVLGNGWYNCHSSEVWHFDKASWRAYPKLRLRLDVDGRFALGSDSSWKVADGPITFDGLRNGETYDARLELGGWLSADYDDSRWGQAARTPPPGGRLVEQTMPPCKVVETLPVRQSFDAPAGTVYDFGVNIAGWARIEVTGAAGSEIVVKYGERLDESHNLDQRHIAQYLLAGDFQTDRYILKGEGLETWEPRFTYHGFCYAQVSVNGDAKVEKIEARRVRTAFDRIGSFSCSDSVLNKLHECAVRSYEGNFVGIPTDCPHREKNGWIGDAKLAAETGLCNFDASSSYAYWLDTLAEAQRPSGQMPGIAPTAGWGYNWGSGPAWDSALFEIPWNIYLYTGDFAPIARLYDAMRRYIDYCADMADNNILSFGLGDWNHVDPAAMVAPEFISTAYYFSVCSMMAKFAKITERGKDVKLYSGLSEDIRRSFNSRFHKGDGLYAKGEPTAQACVLQMGLAEEPERKRTIERLVSAVELAGGKACFGFLGAKIVPRALAENGHVDLAYRLITQDEFPGWGYWLKQGATSLWEDWRGAQSLNHIAFGDVGAWMYRYLAGITPDPERPGFEHVLVKPNPAGNLRAVKYTHLSPRGEIALEWNLKDGLFTLDLSIPEKSCATVILPDGSSTEAKPGRHQFRSEGRL